MLFNSPAFALFLPVMLALYWWLRGAARGWALLLGSYFFYSCWDWRFTSLLMVSTVVDYLCGRGLGQAFSSTRRRLLLYCSVFTNLGILAGFKYFDFFRDSAAATLSSLGLDPDLPTLSVILPMGISFYTFQSMSYTIDVYRGMKPEKSLRVFATYVACFPQLVAGPIMRANDLIPQLKGDRHLTKNDWSTGIYRIFRGLFKKMVVADILSLYVDMVFADPGTFSGISCWIALYAYAFQIYMDFSGYTDVALGVGHMLGFKLTENFDSPYLAASPSEFWRRWHITLSTWLRDYLYIPLGGSRCSRIINVRNLYITMALGGLWHGAAWTFVAWGIYHATLLAAERLIGGRVRATNSTPTSIAIRAIKIVAMFHLTCLGWLLFRAPDFETVGIMLDQLLHPVGGPVAGKRILLIVALCAFAHVLPWFKSLGERLARCPALVQGSLAGACLWALMLLNPGAKPFIYFRF